MLKKLEIRLTQLTKDSIDRLFPTLKKYPLTINLEIPKDRKHGDFTSNVALQISSFLKKKPLDVAEITQQELLRKIKKTKLHKFVEDIQIKKPGFINFFLTQDFFLKLLKIIAETPGKFRPPNLGRGKRIQIEFVSANPTGPLSIAHGRQATVGDSLANILELCGYKVTREYFINDEGNQIDALAKSVYARYLELHNKKASLPKDGYQGNYIIDIAKEFNKKFGNRFINGLGDKLNLVLTFSLSKILSDIKSDLDNFRVHMDVWFSQKKLTEQGEIAKVLKELKNKGLIYKKDNALWFKSSQFGDDKDRVVVKATGEYTYLAPDIAYHKDKFKRGFSKVLNIWGPDHHGYIKRLKAAVKALDYPEDFVEVLIIQLASLYRAGKVVPMSTRKGEYVTLAELINEIGIDAARFFFLMRKRNSHLDLDIELAKKKSLDNPVYYIQYAHARICSIMEHHRNLKRLSKRTHYSLLKSPEEKKLMHILAEFFYIIELSAINYEPYFLTVYLREVAEAFHCFYQRHRVLGEDEALTTARIKLIVATKNILSEGLATLGVSSPTTM